MTRTPEKKPLTPPSGIDHVNVIGGSGFIGASLNAR